MNNIFKKLLVLVVFALISNNELNAQALVQLIHNSPDPAAASVDIYFNDVKYKDNIGFRQAGGFSTVSVMSNLIVKIADPTSEGPTDKVLATFDMGSVEIGKGYVLMVNGVLGMNYEKGDAAYDINLNINKTNIGTPIQADNANAVEIFVGHGSTDAPLVNVYDATNTTPLVSNLAYNTVSEKLSLDPSSYVLNITPANDPATIVASYSAPLATAKGFKAFVFASGFLTPENEPDGKTNKFGLFVTLPDGSIIELPTNNPTNENAFVQVIHNSPDPAAAIVDIYVNDAKPEVLNDFKFRTATSFLELPSNEDIIVKIAAPSSENADDKIIATINLGKLEKSKRYYVTANGVVGTGFNIPEGREIGFNLKVNVLDDTEIKDGDIRLNVLHGSTDAPAVDIFANEYIKLVENIDYNSYSAFLDVKLDNYSIHLSPAGTEAKAARFIAPLELLKSSLAEENIDLNQALVFASGFLDPMNQGISEDLYDEYSFGLYAVIPEGAVVELFNFSSSSLVQIIHNSPDPLLNTVDIYFNGEKLEETEDFTYLSSTGTLDVPAGVPINVSINAGDSENANDKVLKVFENVVFEQFKDYVVVANGVATPNFTNPFDRDITPSLSVKEIKMFAKNANEFEFVSFHGVTDAPAVDIVVNDQIKAVENLDFRAFSEGNSVPAGQYKVGIRAAGGDADVVAYDLNIPNAILGQTGVVFASGFLTADDEGLENTSGRTFAVNVALNDGTVIPLQLFTSVEDFVIDENIFSIYPNPTTDFINLNLNKIDINSINEVKIFDINGVNILNQTNNITNNLDVTSLSNGVYFIKIDSNEKTYIAKFNISK